MILKFKSWSFTAYQNWAKCPFYALHKHLLRTPEPPSPALEKGRLVHEEAERLVHVMDRHRHTKSTLVSFPDSLVKLKNEFIELMECPDRVYTEKRLNLTRGWRVASGVPWLRMVADLVQYSRWVTPMLIVDYKTGKEYPDVYQQLELYAAGFQNVYAPQEVQVEAWYTETGKVLRQSYNRAQCRRLRSEWKEKVKPMFAEREFAPTENWTCRWCYLSREKDGPCSIA